jgi:hypothetical protein
LLIIRPAYEEVTHCTALWADEIIAKLSEIGVKYIDCKGDNATLKIIKEHISGNSINTIVFYGHGEYPNGHKWFGQHKEIILHVNNLLLLKNKFVYDLSCCSGKSIGKRSIKEGARCYIGYKNEFKISTKEPIVGYFKKAANYLLLNEMIINRSTVKTALERTKDYYQELVDELEEKLLEIDNLALGPRYIFAIFSLLENRKSLAVYGDRLLSLSWRAIE